MKRITILAGHYGSGKSEIAVNLAIEESINTLVDIDIVNPYFRSRALRKLLNDHGVQVIESTIENSTGSDLPFISAKGSHPFINKDLRAIYDLGGTELGAKVLMQYRDFIQDREAIDLLVVINVFRPETATVEQIIESIKKLEDTGQIKVTGLINNTNLMDETTEVMILQGEAIIAQVAEQLSLPIRYTFIEETVKTKTHFMGENKSLIRHVAKHWL